MNSPSSEHERHFWRHFVWGVLLGAGLGWLFWAVFLGSSGGASMWMSAGWGALICGLLAGWFGEDFWEFVVRVFTSWW